jgi:2-polyprenyl-3-methyl-5-hydroxy-6-metoxy-1,4-benzoquinol methylase
MAANLLSRVQVSTYTEPNRYPEVFSLAAALTEPLATERARRVLSYGCSIGEEPFVLANTYFPDADILAVDLDEALLAEARAHRSVGDRIRYALSTHATLSAHAPFDVIFAMSVLCRWPDTEHMHDISALLPFESFVHQVEALDALLQPNGLLVIYNANYSLLDTPLADRYEVVLHPSITTCGFVRRFSPTGHRAPEGARDCLFIKRSQAFAPNETPAARGR